MGTEYPDAIDYFVDRSRVFVNQNSHSAVVLHGTGGSAAQTARQLGDYFRVNASQVSVHYGIDRDGVICQYVLEQDGAAGNCCLEAGHDPFWDQFGGDNLNKHTISIEHINDAANSLPLTDAQKQASFQLVAWLCGQYGLTFDQIKTHASIAPSSRARCPGAAYPLDELINYLQGASPMIFDENSPLFASFFTKVTNQSWLCNSNGKSIALGMLEYYKTLSFDPQTQLPCVGLPLTNETYIPRLDNAPLSYILCERGVLIYDPQHVYDSPPGSGPVYMGHINSGTLAYEVLVSPLRDQIATLQARINSNPAMQAIRAYKQAQEEMLGLIV